ncbi:MAG TPA: TetR/AcrR family transcriptional regulator [Anaerolineaceae bacterium]|nr:TetR/AcrR family transcriptional regulator [Anaerolineaceae bacterium]
MANKPKPEHENANRILAMAWRLFQQKGYKGVTIDEICSGCGLTKPTLYYYYRDKEGLFVSVLQHQLALFNRVLTQPGNIEQQLQRLAVAILENFQIEYSVLMRDRAHIKKPENQAAVREAFRSGLFNPLLLLMETGLKNGDLQARNPEVLTLAFLGIINNFINRGAESGTSTAELAAELTQLFLQGAKGQRAGFT